MHWTPAVQPIRDTMPVYLSAIFPKMLRVAGRVAYGVAIGAITSVDYIHEVIQPRVRAAAADFDLAASYRNILQLRRV